MSRIYILKKDNTGTTRHFTKIEDGLSFFMAHNTMHKPKLYSTAVYKDVGQFDSLTVHA